MALKNNATLVVGAGNYFIAPTGTAKPTDLSDIDTPWENIGHTSLDDIFSFSSEGGDSTTLGTLQAKVLRSTQAPRVESFSIILNQFDRASLRLYFGANAPVLDDGDVAVPSDPTATEAAFLAVFVDGANTFSIYVPRAEIFRGDDVSVADAESLVGLPLTIKPLAYLTNTYNYTMSPLGGIPATGATAGTPGSFTPTGADRPPSLTALVAAAVAASPSTAWTVGQNVVLDDGSTAYWDGSEWKAGAAPGD